MRTTTILLVVLFLSGLGCAGRIANRIHKSYSPVLTDKSVAKNRQFKKDLKDCRATAIENVDTSVWADVDIALTSPPVTQSLMYEQRANTREGKYREIVKNCLESKGYALIY